MTRPSGPLDLLRKRGCPHHPRDGPRGPPARGRARGSIFCRLGLVGKLPTFHIGVRNQAPTAINVVVVMIGPSPYLAGRPPREWEISFIRRRGAPAERASAVAIMPRFAAASRRSPRARPHRAVPSLSASGRQRRLPTARTFEAVHSRQSETHSAWACATTIMLRESQIFRTERLEASNAARCRRSQSVILLSTLARKSL